MPLTIDHIHPILSGITSSDNVYFSIGGGILVFMSGIWGFMQIKSLLNDQKESNKRFSRNEKRYNAFVERQERKKSNSFGRSENKRINNNMRNWLRKNR